jgi:hypothetical protein
MEDDLKTKRKMEDTLSKIMEDDLNKKWMTPQITKK